MEALQRLFRPQLPGLLPWPPLPAGAWTAPLLLPLLPSWFLLLPPLRPLLLLLVGRPWGAPF